jgi:queuine tRNA-ribosyltransferase
MADDFSFELLATDGQARAGTFHTPHGAVATPVFMPVGTQATVKTLTPDEVEGLGASMILANTYHLFLRPGHALVEELGGLHRFMRWDGPILTDSGGFQVFSLARINKIKDEGVVFRSHIDGSSHLFTPEGVMDIQRSLGADVVMAFDQCPPGGATREETTEANRRTLMWLERCRNRFQEAATREGGQTQALFPVLQGNVYDDLRLQQARDVMALGDWPGLAIGGLSVGEAKEDMWRTVGLLDPVLPTNGPRYLMGVGYPNDLLRAVALGVDLFDCVAPTRNARHGTVWTREEGQVNLKAARFKTDTLPVDPSCDCYTCQNFSRAFIRHLITSKEVLGTMLCTQHNTRFYQRLMEESRSAIEKREFREFKLDWLQRLQDKK